MAGLDVVLAGDDAKLTLEFPDPPPRKLERDPYLWLDIGVRGRAGSSRFSGRAGVTAGEVQRFLAELEEVVEALDGTARFQPMQEEVEITVTVAGTGGAEVTVVIREQQQAEVELRWVFGTDQTYLKQTVRDLTRVCDRLPEE